MKFYRIPLLMLLGAISAAVVWLAYLAILLLRYPVPVPTLSSDLWAWVLGLPAGIGALTGSLFPVWQRGLHIRSRIMRSISLWMTVSVILVALQFVLLPIQDVVLGIFSTDFLIWLLCAAGAGTCFHLLRLLTGETMEAEAAVLGKLRHTLGFKTRHTRSLRGLAMVFDLQGFAAFFNQPWAKNYVSEYLDLVLSGVSIELFGGQRFWGDGRTIPSLMRPVHQKFLGDGMLYIWTPPVGRDSFPEEFVSELVRRTCGLNDELPLINVASVGAIPTSFQLPERIRFGLAGGQIYELTRTDSADKEYLGFCINLASRLQGYCPRLSFLASARVHVPDDTVADAGLAHTMATQIKGFADEEVLVREDEFVRLPTEIQDSLFAAPPD